MLFCFHCFCCLPAFSRQLPATGESERLSYNGWQGMGSERKVYRLFLFLLGENALPLSLPVQCLIFLPYPQFHSDAKSFKYVPALYCVCMFHLDRYLHACVSECVRTITLTCLHTELIPISNKRKGNGGWKLFFALLPFLPTKKREREIILTGSGLCGFHLSRRLNL